MVKWSAADLANSTKRKDPKPKQSYREQLVTTDVQEALSAITINRKATKGLYNEAGGYIEMELKDGSKWKVTVTRV